MAEPFHRKRRDLFRATKPCQAARPGRAGYYWGHGSALLVQSISIQRDLHALNADDPPVGCVVALHAWLGQMAADDAKPKRYSSSDSARVAASFLHQMFV